MEIFGQNLAVIKNPIIRDGVTRFGEISPLWNFLDVLWQFVKGIFTIWQICYALGLIFIVANGQISKK